MGHIPYPDVDKALAQLDRHDYERRPLARPVQQVQSAIARAFHIPLRQIGAPRPAALNGEACTGGAAIDHDETGVCDHTDDAEPALQVPCPLWQCGAPAGEPCEGGTHTQRRVRYDVVSEAIEHNIRHNTDGG